MKCTNAATVHFMHPTASQNMKVLGIIPARGGSKGVPRKNLAPLRGKPLLAYTAEVALAAKTLSRLILSTDDEEIAAVGRELGLDAPFLRPAELAEDWTPTLPVIQHALAFAEAQDGRYDAVCLLQPTSPLRRATDIDACVAMLLDVQIDTVLSVLPVPHTYNPHWIYFPQQDGTLRLSTGEAEPIARRQELPTAMHRDGAIYVVRRDVICERQSLYGSRVAGYQVPRGRELNIDTTDDLADATAALQEFFDIRPTSSRKP